MKFISKDDILNSVTMTDMIDALRKGFQLGAEVPLRHHHNIPLEGQDATLLLMPAWSISNDPSSYIGIKLATVHPDNNAQDLPAIGANYLLLDKQTGTSLAIIDGAILTAMRTTGAAALASSYLAMPQSSHLAVLGAGVLAPWTIRAHRAIRPITHVSIWNHNSERAEKLAASLQQSDEFKDLTFMVPKTVKDTVSKADIISCVTLSSKPLVTNGMLKQGAHLDLIGSFKPDMRETDGAVIKECALFVDTYEGALKEAGDIIQAINEGYITQDHILGDFNAICNSEIDATVYQNQTTIFKGTGTALEDLFGAALIYERNQS